MSHTVLIANPVAGGGRARRVAERALVRMEPAGSVELSLTRGAGHARELAAAAVSAGATRVVVCGGDGTINEVASALVHTAVPLGVLPFGRGNDLARALALPTRLDPALAVLAGGVVRRIDVGMVNDRVFCTVAAAGFDAEVAHRVRTGIWHRAGRVGYVLGVIRSLASLEARLVHLEGEFGRRDGRYLLAAVSNTGWYGGGIQIAPNAQPDDGLLDCCLVREISRIKLLRLFPLAYRGGHLRYPEVEIVRTRRLRVTVEGQWPIITDGEPAGSTPTTFEVVPQALSVLVAPPLT
jgi:diacylglycerol kinase (ATP)